MNKDLSNKIETTTEEERQEALEIRKRAEQEVEKEIQEEIEQEKLRQQGQPKHGEKVEEIIRKKAKQEEERKRIIREKTKLEEQAKKDDEERIKQEEQAKKDDEERIKQEQQAKKDDEEGKRMEEQAKINEEERIKTEKEKQEKLRIEKNEEERIRQEEQAKRETEKKKVKQKEELRQAEGQKVKQKTEQEQKKTTQEIEEEERKKFLTRIYSEEKQEISLKKMAPNKLKLKSRPSESMPYPPKRPSEKKKLISRLLAIAIITIFLLGIFSLWYWVLRNKETTPTPPATTPVLDEKEIDIPEITIPDSLFLVNNNEILEVASLEEVPNLLDLLLEKDLVQNEFTRIIIKNLEENKTVGLKEFFNIFEIKTPAYFNQKLENDFTLFIFTSEQEKRLGFVAEIKERQDFQKMLLGWESTIEADTEKLFKALNKETPLVAPNFQEAKYQNIDLRCLSFPVENFGICWAIMDNLFIFTSSGESILKLIEKLQ